MKKLVTILIAVIITLIIAFGVVTRAKGQTYKIETVCHDYRNRCQKASGEIQVRGDSISIIINQVETIYLKFVRCSKFRKDTYYEIEKIGKGKSFVWVSWDEIIYIRPYNKVTYYKRKI